MCRSIAQFMWFLHLLLTADWHLHACSTIYRVSMVPELVPAAAACMLQISLLYAGRAVQIVVMMGCYDI
jgi:hypothetical protein